MARCGCSGTSCSCVVQGVGAISVTGSGSGASPYIVSGGAELTVVDSDTVDLSLTGDGSSGDPYVLQADATVDVESLANLDVTGLSTGDTLVYNGTDWDVAPAPTAAPGAVVTDSTLTGDGSIGDPLAIAPQATGTYTPIWTASTSNPSIGSGSITGRYAVDPTSAWVDVSIEIIAASDTAKGSGTWSLTLPPGLDAMPGRGQVLSLLVTTTGGYPRVGVALLNGGTSIVRLYVTVPTASTGARWIDSSIMSTWGPGQRLLISGRYERDV